MLWTGNTAAAMQWLFAAWLLTEVLIIMRRTCHV
jgi:hypothetical protein